MKNWMKSGFLKRGLAMLLALVMVLSFVPVTEVSAETAQKVLYLKPSTNWLQNNERFAAYFFGNGETWADVVNVGGGYYQVSVPTGYTSVIFCRMNGGTDTNGWDNKWDQTQDLTVPTDEKACYVLSGEVQDYKALGTWTNDTPVFYVAGEPSLCDSEWVAGDAANKMTLNAENGLYEKAYPQVAAGTYQFKITDGTWTNSWGSGGSNYSMTLPAGAVYDVVIGFKAADKSISVNFTAYYAVEVTSAEGGTVAADKNPATAGETVTLTVTPGEGKELESLTVKDASGAEVPMSGNSFTMPESDVTVTAVFKDAAAADPVDYYLFGFINNANYGCESDWQNLGEYKFVDGELTAVFEQDSYIAVKTGDNANWYMAETYANGTETVLKNTSTGAAEKMYVPAGEKLTFTLVPGEGDTLKLSYVIKAPEYAVSGYPGVTGSEQLTLNQDETAYEKVYAAVPDGEYTLTVTKNGQTLTNGTQKFTVYTACDVTLSVDAATGAVRVSGDGLAPLPEYEVTLHFANTLGWGAVNLYSWLPTGGGETVGTWPTWPGATVTLDEDGFYTATLKYKGSENKGVNFIFNNGTTQTVDLALKPSDFTDNKAEKWVVLTETDESGKYKADILDSGDSIAVSPVVKDKSVTFQYQAPNATSVEVRGDFCGWDNGIAMTKNEHGIWSVTVNDVTPGVHEYKFYVDGEYVADPLNSWVNNNNSVFLIGDPDLDKNEITVEIHYTRPDGNYTNWNVYGWNSLGSQQYDFVAGEKEAVAKAVMDGRAVQNLNFKIRLSEGSNKWVKEEAQVTVDLSTIVSGTVRVYFTAGSQTATQNLSADVVNGNKIADVQYDYVANTITITTAKPVADAATAFELVNNQGVTMTPKSDSDKSYTYTVSKALSLEQLHQYKIRFNEDVNETYKASVLYDISCDNAYATEDFAEKYTYTGSDLGATYSANSTTFKVWAPTAASVQVNLYSTGSDSEDGATELGTHSLTPVENGKGTWSVTVSGDLKNVYYTYSVEVDGKTVEVIDPYARAAGVNGQRGMVVDLDSTDPTGWSTDKNPNASTSYTDAVIYELHVRDFSIDESSGISAGNRGKYLAFTERGTTVDGKGSISTGVDYLEKLGITHLHLLPVYDYGSVDESKLSTPQFNWGYDPVNYNIPEGSYSTNPYDGNVRINEMKQMVQSLHNSGISVIMDVVYNHVYDADTFSFNQIVPDYFSRVDSNRSGCGNDTASEREMVRKYIVDSVLYWAEEYHIDGFRFDLVGLLDIVTINQIVSDVHAVRPDIIFYGEGWDMDDTNKEPGTEMAKQGNASKTPGFAYFSDSIRNLLGGDNGSTDSSKLGFVTGKANGKESDVVANFLANPWWTSNPTQVIQYASCHDNYTLADKLILSTGKTAIDADIRKMSNLAAAVYMTAQGVPFIHAGEEFFREKLDASGKRVENSYNASDYVNHIEWSNLEKAEYAASSAYYQGLIAFRKAHPVLRLTNSTDIKAKVVNQQASGNLVSFWLDGSEVQGETHDSIYVIFNANSTAKSVTLPEGDWDVCVKGDKAGTAVLETVSGTVSVPGISALVLVQKTSTQKPTPPAAKSDVALTGEFNSWNHNNFMDYADETNTLVTATVSVPAGSYKFKVRQGDNWYGYNGAITDTTTDLQMNTSAGDAVLAASGGAYTFTFDPGTGKLTVAYDPEGGDFGDPNEYYLYGYINGADYATGAEPGDYKFDTEGKLTVTFEDDSYVCVKNGDGSKKFMTDGWLGSVTEATMYEISQYPLEKADKLVVPGKTEVTFTLVVNDDNTVKLSYTLNVQSVEDASGVQQGLVLHCWNWSFAEIEKNLPLIAQQGYAAIQTSPVQPLKEATNLTTNSVGTHWWVYYQPVDFVITTDSGNALGTKEDLQSLIDAAHGYGIQVIVDVVANHLANKTGNDLSDKIPEKYRADEFWHDITTNTSNYDDRYDVTQRCMGGLPDLNTSNKTLQGDVLAFLNSLVDMGVDGFRFDAAKHIETPDDDKSFASDFWPTVIGGAEAYALETQGKDLYIYGELLDTIKGVPVSAYTKYMAVTDNSWGNSLRKNVAAGNAAMSAGYDRAVDADVLVLWAESHDTYATDQEAQSSMGVSEEDIIKTWALVAARKDAMGLYLARPESVSQALGVASVTGWAEPAVGEINAFHNFFVGKAEHIANEGGISYVERGDSGVILVQVADGTGVVSVTAHAMADGTYTDQLTGNTFTVADGKITGTIGETGIAVVYNVPTYAVSVGTFDGGKVTADVETAEEGATVTLTVKADEGKELDTLTVTDAAGMVVTLSQKDGAYTFTMPAAAVTVKATFKAATQTPDPKPTYSVSVGQIQGGKVTVSVDKAEAGSVVTLTVKADEGKELDKLTVTDGDGKAVTLTEKDGAYTFTMPASGVTVSATFKDKATAPDTKPDTDPDTKPDTDPDTKPDTDPDTEPDPEPVVYKIISGADSQWQQGSKDTVKVTCDGDYAKFKGLQVDGKDLDAKHYTAKSGSTVVELKKSYLDTLTVGKYKLTFVYSDGTAETTFTVTAKTADGSNSTTGDSFPGMAIFAVLILSMAGIAVLVPVIRKRRYE